MHTNQTAVILAAACTFAAGLAISPLASRAGAQPEEASKAPAGSPQATPAAQRPNFGQMLVDGLKATEGCLGVESAEYASGKIGIIAWFENVDAAERWYYSETHKRFMNMAGADPQSRKPMQHIENRDTPVMVMATITMGGEGPKLGFMPISQISIELYAPLPGGAAVNGRLAPESFPIQHFRSLGN